MPRKTETPVTTVLSFAVTPAEAEAIDALVRSIRMHTGELLTRSSFLRDVVVARIAAERPVHP